MPKIRWLKSSPKSEQSWESEVSLSQSASVIVTPFQNRTCLIKWQYLHRGKIDSKKYSKCTWLVMKVKGFSINLANKTVHLPVKLARDLEKYALYYKNILAHKFCPS